MARIILPTGIVIEGTPAELTKILKGITPPSTPAPEPEPKSPAFQINPDEMPWWHKPDPQTVDPEKLLPETQQRILVALKTLKQTYWHDVQEYVEREFGTPKSTFKRHLDKLCDTGWARFHRGCQITLLAPVSSTVPVPFLVSAQNGTCAGEAGTIRIRNQKDSESESLDSHVPHVRARGRRVPAQPAAQGSGTVPVVTPEKPVAESSVARKSLRTASQKEKSSGASSPLGTVTGLEGAQARSLVRRVTAGLRAQTERRTAKPRREERDLTPPAWIAAADEAWWASLDAQDAEGRGFGQYL